MEELYWLDCLASVYTDVHVSVKKIGMSSIWLIVLTFLLKIWSTWHYLMFPSLQEGQRTRGKDVYFVHIWNNWWNYKKIRHKEVHKINLWNLLGFGLKERVENKVSFYFSPQNVSHISLKIRVKYMLMSRFAYILVCGRSFTNGRFRLSKYFYHYQPLMGSFYYLTLFNRSIFVI